MNIILSERPLFIFLVLSLFILLAGFFLIYLNLDKLSYPLILHFSQSQGVDLVGGKIDLWGVLIMGTLVVLINTILGAVVFYRQRILTYILLTSNVLIAILALIIIGQVISLN